MIEISSDYMTLTIEDKVIATARFSQYAAADGSGVWIVSWCTNRLFNSDEAVTVQAVAGSATWTRMRALPRYLRSCAGDRPAYQDHDAARGHPFYLNVRDTREVGYIWEALCGACH